MMRSFLMNGGLIAVFGVMIITFVLIADWWQRREFSIERENFHRSLIDAYFLDHYFFPEMFNNEQLVNKYYYLKQLISKEPGPDDGEEYKNYLDEGGDYFINEKIKRIEEISSKRKIDFA